MTPDLNEDSNSMATTSGQAAGSSEEANGDGQAGTSTRRGIKKLTGVHDKNAKKKKRVTTAVNQQVISTTTTITTAKLVKRTRLEHRQERDDEDDNDDDDDGDDSDAAIHGRLLRAKTSSHVAVSSKKPPLDINHEYVFWLYILGVLFKHSKLRLFSKSKSVQVILITSKSILKI